MLVLQNGLREKGPAPASSPPQYVYAFDGYTSAILRNCMSSEHGAPARFVRYVRTSQWKALRRRRNVLDWISTGASLLKLVEAFAIWQNGSIVLGLLTVANWAWFFLCAVCLQLAGLSREYSEYFDANDDTKNSKGYCHDYLAGELPSVQITGQYRKVIFNVPPSVRGHLGWRLTWGFGALICTGSLVATYTLIGSQPETATAVWIGFQLLWMVLRSAFFYFAHETEGIRHGVPKLVRDWELGQYGQRILALASGVSRYQTMLHPRMPYCYTEDLQDAAAVHRAIRSSEHLFDKSRMALDASLDVSYGGHVTAEVDLKAVIGDTLLSSMAWLVGSPYTSMDLYDCCLVVVAVGNRTALVPTVRVLSGHVKEVRQPRVEAERAVVGEHTPKGVANDGVDIGWVFWIPLDADRWLYFVGDLEFLGKRRMEVLSSAEVSKRLGVADLFVSLRDVRDVENVRRKSGDVARLLTGLLNDSTSFGQDVPPPYRVTLETMAGGRK